MNIHETCKCTDERNEEKRKLEKDIISNALRHITNDKRKDFDDTHAMMLEKHLTKNKGDSGCRNVIDMIMNKEPIIDVTPEDRTLYFNETGIYSSDEDVKRYLDSSEHQHPLSREYKVVNDRPQVNHYLQGSIEPVDFIASHKLNFNLGNCIKYVARCNHKGSKVQDLKKAIDYINFELEKEI